jgi:hypothetical protein
VKFGEADAEVIAAIVTAKVTAKLEPKFMELEARISALPPPAQGSPTITATGRGRSLLDVLQATNRIRDLSGGEGPAVLSATQSVDLRSKRTEFAVVQALAPHLVRLLLPDARADDPCPLVLVNSKRLPWLVQAGTPARSMPRTKPDLFVSWRPLVTLRAGGADQILREPDDRYVFGTLGGYALQKLGCVAVMLEAKKDSVDTEAFGELGGYHSCIPGGCDGMVFGSSSFWMYRSLDGHPVSLEKGSWTAEGSADAIKAFFSRSHAPPRLVLVLRELLTRLNARCIHVPVAAAPPKPAEQRCYLGSGSSGHVFAVGPPERPRALKVFLSPPHARVETEFERLRLAAASGAPVIAPVPDSCVLVEVAQPDGSVVAGGGFLLERVGTEFVVDSAEKCAAAFSSLAGLHRVQVIHGDARLPNLLLVDGEPAWVDLFDSVNAIEGEAAISRNAFNDAEYLARSVLGLMAASAMPGRVPTALNVYRSN